MLRVSVERVETRVEVYVNGRRATLRGDIVAQHEYEYALATRARPDGRMSLLLTAGLTEAPRLRRCGGRQSC